MSDMTEYELHSQGGVIAMSPKYDGRDPMRNRPHSNGTDTTMTITRYGLGRGYAGNTGSPAITEQADGAYVRYEDHLRLQDACEAHNEMLLGRLKLAEGAPVGTLIDEGTKPANPTIKESLTVAEPVKVPGGMLSFDDGSLLVRADGSGYIAVPEDQFTLYDDRCEGPDGPQGSVCWIAELPASEIVALRDFLNGQQQRIVFPSHLRKMWSGGEVQAWLDAYAGCVAQQVSAKGSLERYRQWQAQQDAEKVDPQPVGYFQNVNSMNGLPPQYEQVAAVAKREDDVFPLYRAPVAAQPDPAMAGDAALLDMLETLCNGLEWNIENHPEVMNESDAEALAQARAILKRVQPASGEDAFAGVHIWMGDLSSRQRVDAVSIKHERVAGNALTEACQRALNKIAAMQQERQP